MICEKLPTTKAEIITQLGKQNIHGFRDAASFLTGVSKYGVWNEQTASKEYMLKIRPVIIELLNELKAAAGENKL